MFTNSLSKLKDLRALLAWKRLVSLAEFRKKVSCCPFPFMSTKPRRSTSKESLNSSRSLVLLLIWILPGTLVLSILLATFTVSPKSCHLILSALITPVTMGPELIPTLTSKSSWLKIFLIVGSVSMTFSAKRAMTSAWSSLYTGAPVIAWYPSPTVSTLYTPKVSARSSIT